jgi:nucleoid-associated protein YgaU
MVERRVAIRCRIGKTTLARTKAGRTRAPEIAVIRLLPEIWTAATTVVIRHLRETWIAAATGDPLERAVAIASAIAMSRVPEAEEAASVAAAVVQPAPAVRAVPPAWEAEAAGAAEAAGDSETNDGHEGNDRERIEHHETHTPDNCSGFLGSVSFYIPGAIAT